MVCEYGCGQKAKYQFKNGKWCCSKSHSSCPEMRKKNSKINKLFHNNKKKIWLERYGVDNPNKLEKVKIRKKKMWLKKYGVENISQLQKNKEKISEKNRLTISKIKSRYPFFVQIEKLRYNPDKPGEKEIQVHCKNHLCQNSKEQGGWFTPTYSQLYERIRQLEKDYGNAGCYFYCSEECKEQCPLFNLKLDPLKDTEKSYTQEEYEIFREFVLERDNYRCQYCGNAATEIHHERPQKLEPFFALDPDLAWSVCEKCHYKYGHKTGTECSTGRLANKIC